MKKVMSAFGINFDSSYNQQKQANNILNKGKKNPVSERVIRALDNFYMPYNKRLALLMNDDTFLYQRT